MTLKYYLNLTNALFLGTWQYYFRGKTSLCLYYSSQLSMTRWLNCPIFPCSLVCLSDCGKIFLLQLFSSFSFSDFHPARQKYFLSKNTFLLFLLLFCTLCKKIFPLSKYFPSPSFLRDIESNLPISPDILSHIKNQLVDLFSPIWSSLI